MKPLPLIPIGLLLALTLALPLAIRVARTGPAPAVDGFRAMPAPLLDTRHVAARLVDAIIQVESGGNPAMVGQQGERGLMQIKAGTWRDMTIRLFGHPVPFDRAFDPELNRRVGTTYLGFLQDQLLSRQAEWQADERSLLLAAYNAGPGRLRKSGFDLAGMPRQTRDYVERASALHDRLLDDLAEPVRQRLRTAL